MSIKLFSLMRLLLPVSLIAVILSTQIGRQTLSLSPLRANPSVRVTASSLR